MTSIHQVMKAIHVQELKMNRVVGARYSVSTSLDTYSIHSYKSQPNSRTTSFSTNITYRTSVSALEPHQDGRQIPLFLLDLPGWGRADPW